MRLRVNGELREVPDGITVAELLNFMNLASGSVAVEVNELVVRRDRHKEHRLCTEDQVEVVTFVGGG